MQNSESETLSVRCEKCGNIKNLIEMSPIAYGRTIIRGQLVALCDATLHDVCDSCVEKLDYTKLAQMICCDKCGSEHERFAYLDTQGYGLCGHVSENIIHCGYGSSYDYTNIVCNDILKFNVKDGMNICDACISQIMTHSACKMIYT